MKNFSFLIFIAILCTSCLDKEEVTSFEGGVRTLEATDIKATSATCGGYVSFNTNGNNTIIESGICYALTVPTINDDTIRTSKIGEYKIVLQNLTPETTYCVRAYTIIGNDTLYGNQISFRTLKEFEVVVEMLGVTRVTVQSAFCEGFVGIMQGGIDDIIESGFMYTHGENTTDTIKLEKQKGKYTANLTSLISNTEYSVWAYTKTTNEYYYFSDDTVYFKTNNGPYR